MTRALIRIASIAAMLALATGQAGAARGVHHLSGGGTASISQVAMNVTFTSSGSASGSFVCLMAGRSAFVLGDFGLHHNMIVHATPISGSVTGSTATFKGVGTLILDGRKKMSNIHVQVSVNTAAQSFQLTVVEVGTLPVETLETGHLTLR